MCESMVDIQSTTDEIRRGMSASATQGGHKQDNDSQHVKEQCKYVSSKPSSVFISTSFILVTAATSSVPALSTDVLLLSSVELGFISSLTSIVSR